MIKATGVTAKAPWLVHFRQRQSWAPVPSKRRDVAEEAAALLRREAHHRRARDAAEASFLVNGGRYL